MPKRPLILTLVAPSRPEERKRFAELIDALLLTTVALIGFVLLWGTIWALTDGTSSIASWFSFGLELSAPTGAPAGLLRLI